MNTRFLAVALASLSVVACSGGSSGSSVPAVPATAASGAASSGAPGKVTISVFVPARTTASALRRAPLYVSTQTQSASIAVDSGAPVVVNLTPNSPNCSPTTTAERTAGYSCTANVTAAAGQRTFVVTLYSGTSASGSVLSTGRVTATIVGGVANKVNVTLDGVAASINISLATTAPPIGTAVSIPLVVNVLDAGGATIVGSDPYTNPITLTDSDGSGATKLLNGNAPLSARLESPSDVQNLSLSYTGAALKQAVIGATAAHIPAANVTDATLTPVQPISFNDYTTYGYDNARDGYNPNSSAFTPNSLGNLHLAWHVSEDRSSQVSGSQTQRSWRPTSTAIKQSSSSAARTRFLRARRAQRQPSLGHAGIGKRKL